MRVLRSAAKLACAAPLRRLKSHGVALAPTRLHRVRLDDGTHAAIPAVGVGTWQLGGATANVVASAIRAGYRHIDCAASYGNEVEVGQGLAEAAVAGVPREALWVTSKLWNTEHDAARVGPALDATLAALSTDYLDLYLVHWPFTLLPGAPSSDKIRPGDGYCVGYDADR